MDTVDAVYVNGIAKIKMLLTSELNMLLFKKCVSVTKQKTI